MIEDLHWSTAHDPRRRPPTRPHGRSGAPARRGHDPRHRPRSRRATWPRCSPIWNARPPSPASSCGGLDRDEVAALVGVVGRRCRRDRRRHRRQPAARHPHDRRRAVPDPSSALLARRDALLDDRARGLLDLAATFGAEFDANLLAAGCGVPLLDVLESLEAAEAAGLVAPLPGRPGRFAFVHALFRSHRYDALPLRRRLDLHASAASALASPSGDGRLSERARHACLSVPVGDARTAVELAYEAAHEAEHAYAYDEAVAHYERAIVAARSLDPPDARTTNDLMRATRRGTGPPRRPAGRADARRGGRASPSRR